MLLSLMLMLFADVSPMSHFTLMSPFYFFAVVDFRRHADCCQRHAASSRVCYARCYASRCRLPPAAADMLTRHAADAVMFRCYVAASDMPRRP